MSYCEDALGQTQDALEGLYLLAGLEMPPQELKEAAGESEIWTSLFRLVLL